MGLFDDLSSSAGGLLGALRYQNPSDTPVTNALRQIFGLPPMGAGNNGAQSVDESGFSNIFTAPKPPAGPAMPAGVRPDQFSSAARLPLDIAPQVPPQPQLPQQAASAMAQAAPQSSGPGFGDRLSAGFQSFAHSGAPLPALANLISGIATGERTDPRGMALANQTKMATAVYHGLINRGMAPQQAIAIAQAAAADPKIAETLLPQALGLNPPKTIEEGIARQMAGSPGGAGAVGGDPLDMLRKLEAAKASGSAAGKEQGTLQATAQMNLGKAEGIANENLRLIDVLRKHPGRDNGLYWHSKTSGLFPDAAILGNTEAFDANAILKQLKGGAFLEAYNTLKGGGQIANMEGQKATEAIARMDRAQSREGFDKALADYEGAIRRGFAAMAQQAGTGATLNSTKPGNYAWTPGGGLKQLP